MKKNALAMLVMGLAMPTAASVDDLLKASCAKGKACRLPAPPPPGLKTVEVPIKLDGAEGRITSICNCTAESGKNTGVCVRTPARVEKAAANQNATWRTMSGGTWAHQLPGRSCIDVGSATVVLAPMDVTVETWGTFELEPK